MRRRLLTFVTSLFMGTLSIGTIACGDSPTTFGNTGGGGNGGAGGAGASGGSGGSGGAGVCGDGTVDGGEACDDGANNSDTTSDACRSDCTAPSCGDAVVDFLQATVEECDDGNTADGDGCSGSCLIEAPVTCGDGNLDIANGEQCDDGNTTAGDGCSPACLIEAPPSCGDGNLDIADGEQCDDGNTTGGDGCSPTCQFETVGQTCGNGTQEGLEVCDDGNTTGGDGCNPTCNMANTTTLFAGTPSVQGSADGVPNVGQIGGFGALTTDANYLYYADGSNRIVRRVVINPGQADDGELQTIAGVPSPGPVPVPVDNPNGSQAVFRNIEAITTDGNTLWACGGREIRAVDLTSPTLAVTTVAGDYTQPPSCTNGVGLNARFDDIRGCTYFGGLVYFLDGSCAVLRSFDPATGQVVTLAGVDYQMGTTDGSGVGGMPPAGLFVSPRYMTHDNGGVLYIADTNGFKIRTYNITNNTLGTYAGDGACGLVDGVGSAAQIHRPRGMTSDGTSIYFSEFNEHAIRQGLLATGEVSTMLGQHCDGASCGIVGCTGGYAEGVGTMAQLQSPYGIAFHFPTNALFVLDAGNRVIRRVQ
jgi:cysteine-rich repeat protein